MIEGNLPNKQKRLVQAWMEIHKDELIADWELAISGEHPYKIEPLKQELKMLIDVVNVKTQDNFVLLLKFENGEEKEFDCKPLFDKKPFQKLKDKFFFDKAKVEFGTVVWSDEIDIAPETLYLESTPFL